MRLVPSVPDPADALRHVPPPQTVRDTLGSRLREARLLRRLLRLAEAVERERHGRAERSGVADAR